MVKARAKGGTCLDPDDWTGGVKLAVREGMEIELTDEQWASAQKRFSPLTFEVVSESKPEKKKGGKSRGAAG